MNLCLTLDCLLGVVVFSHEGTTTDNGVDTVPLMPGNSDDAEEEEEEYVMVDPTLQLNAIRPVYPMVAQHVVRRSRQCLCVVVRLMGRFLFCSLLLLFNKCQHVNMSTCQH